LVNETLETFYKGAEPFYIKVTNNKKIENPDVKWGAYSEAKLFNCIDKTTEKESAKKIKVGIIAFKIAKNPKLGNGNLSALEQRSHLNLHDLENYDKLAISLAEAPDLCRKSERSIDEYVTITLLTNFLWLKYAEFYNHKRTDEYLFHREVKGCLFDLIPFYDREVKVNKLKEGYICTECHNKLRSANISDEIVKGVQLITTNICYIGWNKAFEKGLQDVRFNFIITALLTAMIINLFSSFLTNDLKENTASVIIIFFEILLIVFGVYFYWINRHYYRIRV
jgi:hypothetical protein